MKNYASHRVLLPDGSTRPMAVLTLSDDGFVSSIDSLHGELPMTQWLIGTIELRQEPDTHAMSAWHDGRRLL